MNDRFGTPDEAFRAAKQSHGSQNPFVRMGMYVPTRAEVATADPAWLAGVLDLWLYESPTELIPNHSQIEDVRAVLLARSDASSPEVASLVAECDRYLRP